MTPKNYFLTRLLALQASFLLAMAPLAPAQDKPAAPAGEAAQPPAASVDVKTPPGFDEVANKALQAMKKRAEEQNIKGVALVAYAEGDTVQSWTSKMLVVGHMTEPASANRKGNNLLGIAYSKASEMADTLKNSGSKARPVMSGEYGYEGGMVAKGKTGILIAAFSGGPSSGDLKVSQAGLDVLKSSL